MVKPATVLARHRKGFRLFWRQLRRVIRSHGAYYHEDRTQLGLEKDAPENRPIEPREMGEVIAISRVGGLHHRYSRELRRAA